MKAMHRMSYRIPQELVLWLNQQSVRENRTPSYIVRRALVRERKIVKRYRKIVETGEVA